MSAASPSPWRRARALLRRWRGLELPVELDARLDRHPLILQIETTRSCNARCRFCIAGQPGGIRGEVLPRPLFERALDEYIALGGEAVSLTPVVGDPLVDPLLFERLELLAGRPAIRQLSLSTNGLAVAQLSDEQLLRLLRQLFLLQISSGGLEAESYRRQFGVDGFASAMTGLDRLLQLRSRVPRSATLLLALRLSHRDQLRQHRQRLNTLRQRGVHVVATWHHHDFGGRLPAASLAGLQLAPAPATPPRSPCAALRVQLTVTARGAVTACNCVDVDASRLRLGDLAAGDRLADIWRGARRAGWLAGFAAGQPPEACCGCSSYQAQTLLTSPGVLGQSLQAGLPPLGFYLNYFGG